MTRLIKNHFNRLRKDDSNLSFKGSCHMQVNRNMYPALFINEMVSHVAGGGGGMVGLDGACDRTMSNSLLRFL